MLQAVALRTAECRPEIPFLFWTGGWRGTLRGTCTSTRRAVLRVSASPRELLLLLPLLFNCIVTRRRGAWGGPSKAAAPRTAGC